MKRQNLSSTFTVIPKKNNNQSRQDKEKYNVLNKATSNNIKEQKNQNKMSNVNRHIKYNSTIGLNDLKINLDINKDNNDENNNSLQNNQSKELISNMSINNLDDLDEKLDIKFPHSINSSITNSLINTQTKTSTFNLKAKIMGVKTKAKKNNNAPIRPNHENRNNKNENLKENVFNTINKMNLINKANNFFQNHNDKNNYIQNKKDNKNINIISNILNQKKYRSIEEKVLEKDSDNVIYPNKNINIIQNYYNMNNNEIYENDYNNKKNNIHYTLVPGYYMKKGIKEKKGIFNFSNNYNNKRFYSMNKRDLRKQFNKNHHFIQKMIDKLPKNNTKVNNFNYDFRKNIKSNFFNRLGNIDNNEEYNYNNIYSRDNKFIYNNYIKNDPNNNNNKTIINNSNLFLKSNTINNNNNIKSVRAQRYLSVEKQRQIKKDNTIENNKIINERNNLNINNHTFYNGFYNYNGKTKKSSSIKSAYISIKLKNFTEFIFNIYNRKFKHLIILFLDIKSILLLSSTSSDFFVNIRNSLYLYFYNNLITDKNKDKFINKVLHSTIKFCSDKIKTQIKNKEFKSFYENLSKKNEIYDELILKDLPRTIPGDINFTKGKSNYNKLYRILTCYSNYNKKIGYAQGINFIIANAIYLFNSEEEVFVFFEGFINILKMDNFIGVENDKKIVNKLNELNIILNKYVPDIIKFFNDNLVSHDFFTIQWLITLFSTSMERKYLVIIWCFMIVFNWKFAYSFIIQILKKYKNKIFNSAESQLCFKMKNILKNDEFKNDFNEIIQNTINFMKNNIVI